MLQQVQNYVLNKNYCHEPKKENTKNRILLNGLLQVLSSEQSKNHSIFVKMQCSPRHVKNKTHFFKRCIILDVSEVIDSSKKGKSHVKQLIFQGHDTYFYCKSQFSKYAFLHFQGQFCIPTLNHDKKSSAIDRREIFSILLKP